MKKLTRYLILSAAFLTILFSFSSCERFLGYDFTVQEAVDNMKKKITENVPADAIISKVSFMTGSSNSFSTKMEIIIVNYYEKGSEELKQVLIYTTQDKISDRTKSIMSFDRKYKPEDGVSIPDLDLSFVASNISEAAKIIDAEGYPFSGLGNYIVIPNSDPEKTVHEFSLQSRADSNTKLKGGKMVTETEYYDIPFLSDGKGNVKVKENSNNK